MSIISYFLQAPEMASPSMRRVCRCVYRMEYFGWETLRTDQPVPAIFSKHVGLALSFHIRVYVNDRLESHVGRVYWVPVNREVMLDIDSARNALSLFLSGIGISTHVHPQIIEEIVHCYGRIDNSIITSPSDQKDFPVIKFRIECDKRVSVSPYAEEEEEEEEEEAVASAIEESVQAETGRPTPAAKFGVDALEKLALDDDGLKMNATCVICLENLHPGKQVTRMPCSHIFHGDCIVQWLETSHLCPLCRFQMPIEPDSDD